MTAGGYADADIAQRAGARNVTRATAAVNMQQARSLRSRDHCDGGNTVAFVCFQPAAAATRLQITWVRQKRFYDVRACWCDRQPLSQGRRADRQYFRVAKFCPVLEQRVPQLLMVHWSCILVLSPSIALGLSALAVNSHGDIRDDATKAAGSGVFVGEEEWQADSSSGPCIEKLQSQLPIQTSRVGR